MLNENGGESNDTDEGSDDGHHPTTECAANIGTAGPSSSTCMGTVYCATSKANTKQTNGRWVGQQIADCKRMGTHADDDCESLKKNKGKYEERWKSQNREREIKEKDTTAPRGKRGRQK